MDAQNLRPVRLVEGAEDHGVVVVRKAKMGRFGTGLLQLFRIDPMLTVRLDALGSEVWRLMDGRTAGEIAAELAARHPDMDNVPERLGQYLATLVGQGMVRLDQQD